MGRKLTEKSWVVCLLCRSDGDKMRVNMIWALCMFEKPRPLTFRGIPPLYSGEWHIISHVSSKHITGHMLVMWPAYLWKLYKGVTDSTCGLAL